MYANHLNIITAVLAKQAAAAVTHTTVQTTSIKPPTVHIQPLQNSKNQKHRPRHEKLSLNAYYVCMEADSLTTIPMIREILVYAAAMPNADMPMDDDYIMVQIVQIVQMRRWRA